MQWSLSPESAATRLRPGPGLRFSRHRPCRFTCEHEPIAGVGCQQPYLLLPSNFQAEAVAGPGRPGRRIGGWTVLGRNKAGGVGSGNPGVTFLKAQGVATGASGSGAAAPQKLSQDPIGGFLLPWRLPGVCQSPGWGMQARDRRAVAEQPQEGHGQVCVGSQQSAGLTALDSLELVVNI